MELAGYITEEKVITDIQVSGDFVAGRQYYPQHTYLYVISMFETEMDGAFVDFLLVHSFNA